MFVLPAYTVGGMELQLASLLANRPEWARDFELETVTFLPPGSEAVKQRFEGLGVANTEFNREETPFPRFFQALYAHVRRRRPDIVHTMLDSSTGAWGRLAAVLAGVPAIVHSDRSLRESGTRAHHRLRPFLDRRTVRFLPNARAIAARLERSGVPAARITVVPSGVDLERFRPAPASERTGNELVAGFVGRFHPVKRIDLLLEALLRLQPAERPGRVLLAGDGAEMPRVGQLVAADPWLEAHVELLGRCDDVPGFLAGIDYLILSSEVEGAPNAVIEAMASARPVVATRVSDVPEIVTDTGFLAEPGDAGALAEALRRMQELSADERRALGQAARLRVERDYDMRVVADRFWEAHLQLLRRPGAAEPQEANRTVTAL